MNFNNNLEQIKQLNIHENQYLAGCEIISYLKKNYHNVILTAQMQSGKTGVAKYITYFFLKTNQTILKNVEIFYICGMNDNDLKRQAIKEFELLLPRSNILFSKDLLNIINTVNTNDNNTNTDDANNTNDNNDRLIIIDESHYAKNKIV